MSEKKRTKSSMNAILGLSESVVLVATRSLPHANFQDPSIPDADVQPAVLPKEHVTVCWKCVVVP